MPQIIIAIIVIALLWAAVNGLFNLLVFFSINYIALLDRVIGSITNVPAISWAISGLLVGSITFFITSELKKLYRPALKLIFIFLCVGLFILNLVLSNNRKEGRVDAFDGNKLINTSEFKFGTLTTNINLRTSPYEQSKVIAKGIRGTKVSIIETNSEWFKVRFNNYEGYVKPNKVSMASYNSNIIEKDIKQGEDYTLAQLKKGDGWHFITPNEGRFSQKLENGSRLSYITFSGNGENNTWRAKYNGDLQIKSDNQLHIKVELFRH